MISFSYCTKIEVHIIKFKQNNGEFTDRLEMKKQTFKTEYYVDMGFKKCLYLGKFTYPKLVTPEPYVMLDSVL